MSKDSPRRPPPPTHRFKRSNTTPIPNEVLDELPALLSGAEHKVMIYLCRRTFGFHRNYEAVSFDQLANGLKVNGRVVDVGAGVSERSAKDAVKTLEEKGYIWVGRYRDPVTGDAANQYAVLVEEDTLGEEDPRVQNLHTPWVQNLHTPLVQNLHPLNKERKKGFRKKAPYSPPSDGSALQLQAQCPIGQCNGTGLLGPDGTVRALLSGETAVCTCPEGIRVLGWAKEMAS